MPGGAESGVCCTVRLLDFFLCEELDVVDMHTGGLRGGIVSLDLYDFSLGEEERGVTSGN